MKVTTTETQAYVYEIDGESKKFESVFNGPLEKRVMPHDALITMIRESVAQRLQACKQNLFQNTSGLYFTSEDLICFSDNSCFVKSSYEAMERILDTTPTEFISDLISAMGYTGMVQAIKAVSRYAVSGDIKNLVIDILLEELVYRSEEEPYE